MYPNTTGHALVYVYDIRQVLDALQPTLDYLLETVAPRNCYGAEELVDLYLSLSIDQFQIVSVQGHCEACHPAVITNSLRQAVAATEELWRTLRFPLESSGCTAIIRRIRTTLWVFIVDPEKLTPISKQH